MLSRVLCTHLGDLLCNVSTTWRIYYNSTAPGSYWRNTKQLIAEALTASSCQLSPWLPIPYITPHDVTAEPKAQPIDMADRKNDEPFAGEDDDTIDPRDFLKRVQRYLMATTWEDADKIDYFETWLKSGSAAEQWLRNLEAGKKSTWKNLCEAFKEQWPERPIV